MNIYFNLLFVALVVISGCSVSNTNSVSSKNFENKNELEKISSNNFKDQNIGLPNKKTEQGYCLADFDNFTFDWFPNDYFSRVKDKNVTLINGKMDTNDTIDGQLMYEGSLENVICADLTGDGKDEAIVTIRVSFSNRAQPMRIMIYGEKNRKIKLLWHYETGTKEKDLRSLTISNSKELILEEYDNYYKEPAVCCPKRFFTSYFLYKNSDFKLIKVVENKYEKSYREFLGYNVSQ